METDDDADRSTPADVGPVPGSTSAGPGPGDGLRWVIAALVVGLWIVLGFLLRLGANAYLLLSIPFVVGFQLGIARQPLRAVWLRGSPRFAWDLRMVALFVVFAIVPACAAVTAACTADWIGLVYGLAAIAGAAGVAYAARAVRRVTVRQLVICVVVVCLISTLLDLINRVVTPNAHSSASGTGPLSGVYWFLLYLPAVFVVEEVFFRGVLDSYLHRAHNSPGWLSAVYVSALWGLWHLPIYFNAAPSFSVVAVVVSLLVVQVALGVPLSVGWRRSGNLLVPGAAHALSDAIRNTLVGLP